MPGHLCSASSVLIQTIHHSSSLFAACRLSHALRIAQYPFEILRQARSFALTVPARTLENNNVQHSVTAVLASLWLSDARIYLELGII